MEKNNGQADAPKDGFIEDYIKCSDYLVRHSVTGISASCELLRQGAEKRKRKKECELIDDILVMCCDLLRNAELAKALIPERENDGRNLSTVNVDRFLAELTSACEEVTNGRCSVTVRSDTMAFVRTDRDMLRYLLLCFIRRRICGNDAEKNIFEAVCEKTGENVRICIRCSGTFVDGEGFGQPEIFEMYYDKIVEGLARRIGAELTMEENGITVEIPLVDGLDTAVLEAAVPERERGFFDPFGVMLRDLAD